MSITRYANISKQKRVVAPNMSHMLPFEKAGNRYRQNVDSNATTKSGLQQSEKGREGYKQPRDLNGAQHNKESATSTMGELILKKKKAERETPVFKHNLEKATSITKSISSGTRRKLTYIDSDDDMEDDMEDDIRSQNQDVSEVCRLQDHGEADENEDMDNIRFGNIQNRRETNGLNSQGTIIFCTSILLHPD